MAVKKVARTDKPLVLITGAAGDIGTALTQSLQPDYRVIGLDIVNAEAADESLDVDLTSEDSIRLALREVADRHGGAFAAVVHLAAYFDFSGEESPLYQTVNVEGTRKLVRALQDYRVERFIYSSTMLVHRPGVPGHRINEDTPIEPGWVYPRSKAEAEAAIREEAGDMPFTLLRLAGVYDEHTCVPTLSHQIARIYERNLKSHLYAGDTGVGQAFLHKADMMAAFRATIDRRQELPAQGEILVGEEHCDSYEAIQNRVGELLHGVEEWKTLRVPGPLARAGAWAEAQAEPVIPDDFDKGEKPFIRPFMIDLANDHYELDIRRAREHLGWEPRHRLFDGLAALADNLKRDPRGWYRDNGITPPDWMAEADDLGRNPDRLLARHNQCYRQQHRQSQWAHYLNMGVGAWLVTSPPALGYAGTWLAWSDLFAGLALAVFAGISLSWRHGWARWVCALVGVWLLFAPLLFWTGSAAGYLNGTVTGLLAIGLSALVRPAPGVSPVALASGPTTPPGWDNNPSSWYQRLPIILLALLGFCISRYLAAYQLGHIDAVWDPLFAGVAGKNGTEAIITSEVSEAWPIPDAGLGGIVYALEIMLGLLGDTRRWRTMPWVVASFGVLIVPLGAVSITFIIIQPILIGTWCTLCLLGAAAMLLQIAYAFNELVATGGFLLRRRQAGAPLLKIFFTGDTDSGRREAEDESFQQADPGTLLRGAFTTGVNLPWNLALCLLIGAWLMFTRVTLGAEGAMADWDHVTGALIIAVTVVAMAGAARPLRWLLLPLALIPLVTPWVYGLAWPARLASLVCGLALIALAWRRGPVPGYYGEWSRWVVRTV
jgi:nucleoside-diphosphate-sugar epimerase